MHSIEPKIAVFSTVLLACIALILGGHQTVPARYDHIETSTAAPINNLAVDAATSAFI